MSTGQHGRDNGHLVADDHERRHHRLVVGRSEHRVHLQNPHVGGTTLLGWKRELASTRRACWWDQLNQMCLRCRNVSDRLNGAGGRWGDD